MNKQVIFFDTEFTTWEGAQDNAWGEPWQFRELVQIGALRFDLGTLEALEEFEILVKPVKNPVLSDFFTSLTGITNQELQQRGVIFREALQAFLEFAGDLPCVSFGGDSWIIRRNLGFHDLPNTENDFNCENIRPWFLEHGRRYGIDETINSGKLAKTLGVNINAIQEHNGLHDVRSIAAAYRFLMQSNSSIQGFRII